MYSILLDVVCLVVALPLIWLRTCSKKEDEKGRDICMIIYEGSSVRPTIIISFSNEDSLSVGSDHVQRKISLACILWPRVDTLEENAVVTDVRLCVPIIISQSSFSGLVSKLFRSPVCNCGFRWALLSVIAEKVH